MSPRDEAHAFSGSDEVVVVALGASAAEGLPNLRRKLHAVIDERDCVPCCVVVDATGAGDVDPAELAADVAGERPPNLPLAVVCTDAPVPDDDAQPHRVDGVVVAPTVRQAIDACRRQGYTS